MRRFLEKSVEKSVGFGGALLLAAAVFLSLPGVTPVRADPSATAVTPPAPGPMCKASGPPLQIEVERLRALVAAHAEAQHTDDGARPVALNNRGHNYNQARVDLSAIDRERRTGR